MQVYECSVPVTCTQTLRPYDSIGMLENESMASDQHQCKIYMNIKIASTTYRNNTIYRVQSLFRPTFYELGTGCDKQKFAWYIQFKIDETFMSQHNSHKN